LQSCVSPADILARGGPAAEALEQALLTRLVALNHERAAEERRGLIRWLRPDYQNCSGGLRPSHDSDAPAPDAPLQDDLPGTESVPSLETENLKLETLAWPQGLPDQVAAIRRLLPTHGQDPETGPAELAERLAACFGRKSQKRTDQIAGILATLKALGHLA
jgi:hypothetical protein